MERLSGRGLGVRGTALGEGLERTRGLANPRSVMSLFTATSASPDREVRPAREFGDGVADNKPGAPLLVRQVTLAWPPPGILATTPENGL